MSFIKYLERLEKIDRLIRMENTGPPGDFARKLNISKSHLYFCLRELKDYGLPIGYNGLKGTYYYREQVKLKVDVCIYKLTNNEVIQIIGENQKKSKISAPLLYNQSGMTYLGT